jgi:molybdopterin-guanine dinucleotide biosynthesis protein A
VSGGAEAPIGVILAGGEGRRIGGAKATVRLHGKPLICYPLEALQRVLDDVVVVAKPSTELPELPGVTVWIEPEFPHHPLLGIMHALSLADGRPVVVCASDLPFVTAEALEQLAGADPRGAPAVIARAGAETQPLLGCYQPETLGLLRTPGGGEEAPLRDALASIGARTVEVDPHILFNVNYPDDLLQAAAMLDPPKAPPAVRKLEPPV